MAGFTLNSVGNVEALEEAGAFDSRAGGVALETLARLSAGPL